VSSLVLNEKPVSNPLILPGRRAWWLGRATKSSSRGAGPRPGLRCLVERAVALPAELCSGGRRVGKRSRLEREIACATRVFHVRCGVSELAPELLGGVIEDVDGTSGVPHDSEGNHCRGARSPDVAENRILEGVVVFHVQVVHFERGRPCVQVDIDGVGWQNDRPKQAILGDPGVKIVKLRVPSRGEDVNSDEGEGDLPHVTITPDVDALMAIHVVGRGQDLLRAGLPVRPRDLGVDERDA
jgi:hypothetical protein